MAIMGGRNRGRIASVVAVAGLMIVFALPAGASALPQSAAPMWPGWPTATSPAWSTSSVTVSG